VSAAGGQTRGEEQQRSAKHEDHSTCRADHVGRLPSADMRANRSYRLLHTRSSRRPVRLDPNRIDHLEVVEVATGEVVLFWDLPAQEGAKRARRLREDLVSLDEEEFLQRWGEA